MLGVERSRGERAHAAPEHEPPAAGGQPRRAAASSRAAYNPGMDCDRITEELTRFFGTARPGIAAAWLFGSVARGTARPGSDVDVAVLTGDPAIRGIEALRLGLEGELERALGMPAQLVILDHAPADLAHRVLRDGILLCEPDRSARIRFEVRARNEYWDLLPYLEEYRKARRSA